MREEQVKQEQMVMGIMEGMAVVLAFLMAQGTSAMAKLSSPIPKMYDLTQITDRLIKDEALRLKPYIDSVGKETIGIGHNLTDKGITKATALFMCREDIDEAVNCFDIYPWFKDLDPVRQQVLICFMFNVGPGTFAQFHTFITCITNKDWNGAATSWENSKWATQVGNRAVIYERILRTGVWE